MAFGLDDLAERVAGLNGIDAGLGVALAEDVEDGAVAGRRLQDADGSARARARIRALQPGSVDHLLDEGAGRAEIVGEAGQARGLDHPLDLSLALAGLGLGIVVTVHESGERGDGGLELPRVLDAHAGEGAQALLPTGLSPLGRARLGAWEAGHGQAGLGAARDADQALDVGPGGDAGEGGRARPGPERGGDGPERGRVDRQALGLLHAGGAVLGAAAREVHPGVEAPLMLGLRLGGRGLSVEPVGLLPVTVRHGGRCFGRGRALLLPALAGLSPTGRGGGRGIGGRRVVSASAAGAEPPGLVTAERTPGAVLRAPRERERIEHDDPGDPVARGLNGGADAQAERERLGKGNLVELRDVAGPADGGAGGRSLGVHLGRGGAVLLGRMCDLRRGRGGLVPACLGGTEGLGHGEREHDGRQKPQALEPLVHDPEPVGARHGKPERPAERRFQGVRRVLPVGVARQEGADVAARADGEERGRHLAALVQPGQALERAGRAGGSAVPLGGEGRAAALRWAVVVGVGLDLALGPLHLRAGAGGVGAEGAGGLVAPRRDPLGERVGRAGGGGRNRLGAGGEAEGGGHG